MRSTRKNTRAPVPNAISSSKPPGSSKRSTRPSRSSRSSSANSVQGSRVERPTRRSPRRKLRASQERIREAIRRLSQVLDDTRDYDDARSSNDSEDTIVLATTQTREPSREPSREATGSDVAPVANMASAQVSSPSQDVAPADDLDGLFEFEDDVDNGWPVGPAPPLEESMPDAPFDFAADPELEGLLDPSLFDSIVVDRQSPISSHTPSPPRQTQPTSEGHSSSSSAALFGTASEQGRAAPEFIIPAELTVQGISVPAVHGGQLPQPSLPPVTDRASGSPSQGLSIFGPPIDDPETLAKREASLAEQRSESTTSFGSSSPNAPARPASPPPVASAPPTAPPRKSPSPTSNTSVGPTRTSRQSNHAATASRQPYPQERPRGTPATAYPSASGQLERRSPTESPTSSNPGYPESSETSDLRFPTGNPHLSFDRYMLGFVRTAMVYYPNQAYQLVTRIWTNSLPPDVITRGLAQRRPVVVITQAALDQFALRFYERLDSSEMRERVWENYALLFPGLSTYPGPMWSVSGAVEGLTRECDCRDCDLSAELGE